MKEASELVCELKVIVDEYLKTHPNISLHALSKRCGLASSTLRRIVNLETKDNPSDSTVIGIVSAITREDKIENLIHQNKGEIKKALIRSYEIVQKHHYRADLKDLMEDREIYIIYKLAANHAGTTHAEIKNLLGIPAISKLEMLLDLNLVYLEAEKIHARNKNFSLPLSIAKKHLTELLRFTYNTGKYVDRSIFLSGSESITKEAYDEIWEIIVNSSKKIGEILNNKDNLGEIPFFYNTILNTMDVDDQKK